MRRPACCPAGSPPPARRTARRRPARLSVLDLAPEGTTMKIGIFVNDVARRSPSTPPPGWPWPPPGGATRSGTSAPVTSPAIPTTPSGPRRAGPPSGPDDLAELPGGAGSPERITVDDLDVLWLRNDPADDVPDRHWAQTAGILFGRLAARRGVDRAQRPGRALAGPEQAVLPALPRRGAPGTPSSPARPKTCASSSADTGGQGRAQAAAGLRRARRLRRRPRRRGQHRPDDRSRHPRRLLHRPGVPARRRRRRRPAVPDERRARCRSTAQYAAFRRVNADRRHPLQHDGRRPRPRRPRSTTTMLRLAELVRPELAGRRHVPGRARHRRRQADGDQRVQPRRPRQRRAADRRRLHRGGRRRPGEEGVMLRRCRSEKQPSTSSRSPGC